jgi:hypothetical protein
MPMGNLNWELALSVTVALGAWTASVFGFGNWLSRRFDRLGEKITDAKDVLSDKIAAHEKLDDTRFEELKLRTMRLQMKMGDFDPGAQIERLSNQ